MLRSSWSENPLLNMESAIEASAARRTVPLGCEKSSGRLGGGRLGVWTVYDAPPSGPSSLVSMVARDGCAQFSGWKFILTGETGECPSLEPSGMGTRGSCFGLSIRRFGGEDGLEDLLCWWCIEFMVAEPTRGGEESTAAMAKGIKVISRIASASEPLSVLERFQLRSAEGGSWGGAQLAQCYCDGCRFSCCLIGAASLFLS